jgi:Flp pilus assembly protein TadG
LYVLAREGSALHLPVDESVMIDMTDCTSQATHQGRKRQRTRGQSMVEFALILPLLLVFLLTAADFGRALTAYITVSSAASEGASFGSRSADNAANTNAIRQAALSEVGADQQIWGVAPVVAVASGTDTQGYPWVEVTVTYTFTPLFSVWPIPNSVPMERTVRMRVLGS